MKNLIADIGRHISKLTRDRKILAEVAKEGARIIQIRTSQGFGVNKDGGKKKPLAALKRSTIKQRKRYSDRLAGGVGPGKSRLTFTGQMIESITSKVANNKAIVYLKGKHRGTSLTNEELATIHEGGLGRGMKKRKFMHFSDKEIKTLTSMVGRKIRNALKKTF